MRIVNNKKFVTLNELAAHLNSKKSEERFFLRSSGACLRMG